ncbi:MAG: TetR/AcrR family transcriptional regulator [Rhodospirillaceae bacterium]|nr:TetR/AcrR family transcriptional regulator [Rhodospirillaceae bacterium]
MGELREAGKEDRRQRILDAAREHLRTNGFEVTTIESIAETAGVSAVTIYNHYRTKGGLLLALVTRSDGILIKKLNQFLNAHPKDALNAVVGFSKIINDHAFSYLNREIWRHVIATSIIEGDTEFGSVYRALDRVLVEMLEKLLSTFTQNGLVSFKCDCLVAAEVLYNVHNARFIEFIIDQTISIEQRDENTRRDLSFVLGNFKSV